MRWLRRPHDLKVAVLITALWSILWVNNDVRVKSPHLSQIGKADES